MTVEKNMGLDQWFEIRTTKVCILYMEQVLLAPILQTKTPNIIPSIQQN